MTIEQLKNLIERDVIKYKYDSYVVDYNSGNYIYFKSISTGSSYKYHYNYLLEFVHIGKLTKDWAFQSI